MKADTGKLYVRFVRRTEASSSLGASSDPTAGKPWAHYLGRLAEVASGRDPGPDPWHGRTGE